MPQLRLYLVGFTLLLLPVGCSSPTGPAAYPNNPAVSDAHGLPRDLATFYFPAADSLPPDYIPRDQRPVDYYPLDPQMMNCARSLSAASRYIRRFKGPVLSNFYLHADIYRFLWRRSFHRPVLLTLRRDSTKITLHTQILSKHISYFPPANRMVESTPLAVPVEAEETITVITPEQWQHFEGLLQKTDFWQLPACQPAFIGDGSTWLLEGHRAKGYHCLLRYNPITTDSLRAACEYLLDLSSARREKRY